MIITWRRALNESSLILARGRGPAGRPSLPALRLVPGSGRTYPAHVKIYTRTGDDGTTGVLGPGRVRKDDPRIEACGSVDELNAALGVARSLDAGGWVTAELAAIQARLFSLGAELAATAPAPLANMERITDADVWALEQAIDRLDAGLSPLVNFVLPAGHVLASQMHLSRTVCRRAERRVVTLGETAPVEPRLVHYLNRLADLLFVMARWCNQRAGVAETEWRPRGRAGGGPGGS